MKIRLNPYSLSTASFVLSIIGIILLYLICSFLFFTFGYWLITLILPVFFAVTLPFTWWYALGAWLIGLVFSLFINFRINIEK